MFIKEDDYIDINIYCKKSKYRYIALTEKEYKDLNTEEQKKFEVLTVKMKALTWGLFNVLQDEAMAEDAKGEQRFNYRIYKENRLKKLIKEWSAKDANGKPIPVNENMIAHLAPPIAESILRAYDEITTLGDDEEGKS